MRAPVPVTCVLALAAAASGARAAAAQDSSAAAIQDSSVARRPPRDTGAHPPVIERAPELPGGEEGRPPAGGEGGTVAVEPAEVIAGMFYGGATVRVSAVVPSGAGVAMLCRDEGHPLVLKEKGKALGVLWMNLGDVAFDEVPSVYLLHTTSELSDLAPDSVLEALGLGAVALAGRCDAEGSDSVFFSELVRLKEDEGLWEEVPGAVEVRTGAAEPEAALATTDFTLPPKAGPGRYEVLVYAFVGTGPELVGSTEFRIRQAGVAAGITTLATQHGVMYGILAVVVAVMVGLFTGVIFGLGSKGGH